MKELGEALKAIFGRIAGFFDLFDLSFFVSGSVTLAALMFWAHLANIGLPFELDGWLRVLAIILGCYINGLICFAIGRWIRIPKRLSKQISFHDSLFKQVLEGHGLSDEKPFKEYLKRADFRGSRRLYIRLWAEVRQMEEISPSLLLLNRYWVMAATYDGLATALIIWAFVFLIWSLGLGVSSQIRLMFGIPTIVFLLLVAYFCLREANRFVRNQVEELVATVAVMRSRARQ
jgi:membrane protein DedA with SNARE-associated domain